MKAKIESGALIGSRTKIFAAHILSGAEIGNDCTISDFCFIENGVRLGNGVKVKCGVALYQGLTVEDNVFIGPGAIFTNDLTPRAAYPKGSQNLSRTIIRRGATIGAGAVILPVEIGEYAFVAAGAVVTKNVPPFSIVRGSPAKVVGFMCSCGKINSLDIEDVRSCKCFNSSEKE